MKKKSLYNLKTIVPVLHRFLCFNLFIAGSMAWAGYGESIEVSSIAENTIPAGWVVVSKNHSGSRFYTGMVQTKTFYTIKDMNGAQYGDSVEVLGESPIPEGWIITNEVMHDKTYYNIVYSIKCVIGASVGHSEEVLYKSPIPHGWTIAGQISTSLHGYNRYLLKNLGNKPFEASSSSSSSGSGSNGWTKMLYK